MKITTTDFYLATWLNANEGIILTDHTRENGRRSIFEFQGNNIDDLVKKFNNNNATMNVKALADSIRELKSIMYVNSTTKPNNTTWNRKENTPNFN